VAKTNQLSGRGLELAPGCAVLITNMPSNLRPDRPQRHLASTNENCQKLLNAWTTIAIFFAAMTLTR